MPCSEDVVRIENYPRKGNTNHFYPKHHCGSCPIVQLQIQGVGFDVTDKDRVYTVCNTSEFFDMLDAVFYTEVPLDHRAPHADANTCRVHVGSNDNGVLSASLSALDARLNLVLCTKKGGHKHIHTSSTNEEFVSRGIDVRELKIKQELNAKQWDNLAEGKSPTTALRVCISPCTPMHMSVCVWGGGHAQTHACMSVHVCVCACVRV